MKITTEWMREHYKELNKLCFGNKLPPCNFQTNMQLRSWGSACVRWQFSWDRRMIMPTNLTIKMSNAYDSPEEVKLNTLVHEMIHIEDYIMHPEHYITINGSRLKRTRGYDAHGSIFFIPEAERLKQYGFNINGTVTKEEQAISQLDEKFLSTYYYIGYLVFNKEYYKKPNLSWYPKGDGQFFKVTSKNVYENICENETILNNRAFNTMGMYCYDYICAYKTNAPKFLTIPSCRGTVKGWFKSFKEWNDILLELGNNADLYDERYWNDVDLNPEATEQIQQALPQEERIPIFSFNTLQGTHFEVKNATRNEIKEKLKIAFPKWGDEAIERALNKYIMKENKISEEDIKLMAESVINRLNGNTLKHRHGENEEVILNDDGSITMEIE